MGEYVALIIKKVQDWEKTQEVGLSLFPLMVPQPGALFQKQ